MHLEERLIFQGMEIIEIKIKNLFMQLQYILRTYYNFCMPGQDGKTPAMRIGITK